MICCNSSILIRITCHFPCKTATAAGTAFAVPAAFLGGEVMVKYHLGLFGLGVFLLLILQHSLSGPD